MRIVLHSGKGGVGTTTVSAATAIAAAASGRRTLLLSTGSAGGLGDALGVDVGAEPTPVAGRQGLSAAEPNLLGELERGWPDLQRCLVGPLGLRGAAALQAEELPVPPGAAEVLALLAVARYADATSGFDVVVADCGPASELLRLLSIPETLGFYADRLLRLVPPGLDALGAARDTLADPAVTDVRLVVTPERAALAAGRRLLGALALQGVPVQAVVVNRLDRSLPTPLLDESFGPLRRSAVAPAATEPVGVAALAGIAEQLFGGTDPVPSRPIDAGTAPRTEGSNGRYRLVLPLPLIDRAEVRLARSGDDLIVTVGSLRRRVGLPSVLRRCRSTGATFRDDALVVEFDADPAQWPDALAAALPATSTAAEPTLPRADLVAAR